MPKAVDRVTRVAADLVDSAAAEGARQSRSAKQLAETIDWVAALVALGVADLTAADSSPALASLGALAKTPDDRTQIRDAYQAFTECSHA